MKAERMAKHLPALNRGAELSALALVQAEAALAELEQRAARQQARDQAERERTQTRFPRLRRDA